MLWFELSLLTALLSAVESALAKKFFADLDPWTMSAYPMLYAFPLFLGILLCTDGPAPDPAFWTTLALLLPLNVAGYLLQMRAIQVSPLSLTMPFLAFTPVFAIVTGNLIVHETPSLGGIVGILAATAGGYVLNLHPGRQSLWEPVRAIWRERGSLYMLGAAFLYGFTGVLGKKSVLEADPLRAAALTFTCLSALTLILLGLGGRLRPARLLSRPGAGLIVAGVLTAHILAHYFAVSLTQTAYMLSIKRLNGLFSVGLGWWLFREQAVGYRLAGAGLMAAGSLLIAFLG